MECVVIATLITGVLENAIHPHSPTALSSLRLLSEQADAQAQAVASATRTTALSDARYRNGLVSQLDLLDARRSELRNRRQALQVRAAQYDATVGLVRALGGAWGGQS